MPDGAGFGHERSPPSPLSNRAAVLHESHASWRWAHKLDGLVQSGAVKDCAELARLGHVSAARVSQIMLLSQLAPALQEYLLFLSAGEAPGISERELRNIAREPRWNRQRELFERLLQN